jgi:hypothetical protein
MDLSLEILQYPTLYVVHTPGRVLYLPDKYSQQLDNVILPRADTNLSKNQADILPSLAKIPPGQLIDNDLLRSALHATPESEFFDVEETGYLNSQRIDWSQYNNPCQLFTSEREFILGSLLSNTPETVLQLHTFRDIFDIKNKGSHFKTKLQKISFIKKVWAWIIQIALWYFGVSQIKTIYW